jgi:hypothetical protein
MHMVVTNHILPSHPNKKLAHPLISTKQEMWLSLTRWLWISTSPRGYPVNQTAPRAPRDMGVFVVWFTSSRGRKTKRYGVCWARLAFCLLLYWVLFTYSAWAFFIITYVGFKLVGPDQAINTNAGGFFPLTRVSSSLSASPSLSQLFTLIHRFPSA